MSFTIKIKISKHSAGSASSNESRYASLFGQGRSLILSFVNACMKFCLLLCDSEQKTRKIHNAKLTAGYDSIGPDRRGVGAVYRFDFPARNKKKQKCRCGIIFSLRRRVKRHPLMSKKKCRGLVAKKSAEDWSQKKVQRTGGEGEDYTLFRH
jgi:hypothetical protein